jgi:hypothetical protein
MEHTYLTAQNLLDFLQQVGIFCKTNTPHVYSIKEQQRVVVVCIPVSDTSKTMTAISLN